MNLCSSLRSKSMTSGSLSWVTNSLGINDHPGINRLTLWQGRFVWSASSVDGLSATEQDAFPQTVETIHRWQSYLANSNNTFLLMNDKLTFQNYLTTGPWHHHLRPLGQLSVQYEHKKECWTQERIIKLRKRAGINILFGGTSGGNVGRKRLLKFIFAETCQNPASAVISA